LKLKCDKTISAFAFKFNLRRYNEEAIGAFQRALAIQRKVWQGAG
jgi:hypothetical protein